MSRGPATYGASYTLDMPPAEHHQPSRKVGKKSTSAWGFLELIAILLTAIPAMLYLPGIQAIRPVLRAGAYLVGLSGLVLPGAVRIHPKTRHPSTSLAMMMIVYLTGALMFSLDRLLAAGAEYALLLSVLAPLFWSVGLVRHPSQLQRMLWLLLLAAGLNSLVGVLQVYNPDRWMPQEFSRHVTVLSMYQYAGADGRLIIRPCGLYDSPGAVCAPGAWAAIVGFATFQAQRHWFPRLIALACAFLGVAAIYLTLVRSALVVVLIGSLTYAALLCLRQRSAAASTFLLTAGGTLITALLFAEIFGGTTIVDRFSSLFHSDPADLYYNSRGVMVEHALVHDAVENPLGVGLGSFGMVPATFGGGFRFAEVQPHAWILDGGIPLLVMYSIAVFVALWHDVKVCLTTRSAAVFQVATCIAAVNVSTAVTIFSQVPFCSQVGMQFWLLTGVLRGASLLEQKGQR